MEIKVQKKIGNDTVNFTIEEKDNKDGLALMCFLTTKDYCNLDGFKESPVFWESNKANTDSGTFTYIKRKCFSKDGKIATSTMGEYKEGGYFWKSWEIYVPKDRPAEIPDDEMISLD